MSFLKKNSPLLLKQLLKTCGSNTTNLTIRNCRNIIIVESKRFLNTNDNNNSNDILKTNNFYKVWILFTFLFFSFSLFLFLFKTMKKLDRLIFVFFLNFSNK
jgi:hypothetical protein